MTISDFQISSVIKSYTMSMKAKAKADEKEPTNGSVVHEDQVMISEDAKRMLFERIGEQMSERFKGHDEEGYVISTTYSG
ncbi:MAG: hypothetical protein NTX75_02440 [Proteobacteria bacterium]|nr:hypothetical protein [Pseudomonadota bacterium]